MTEQDVDRTVSEESASADLLKRLVAALLPASEAEGAELGVAVLAGATPEAVQPGVVEGERLGRAALVIAAGREFPELPAAVSCASANDDVGAALTHELRRLPLLQRVALRAAWSGMADEDAATLLAVSAVEMRGLVNLGLDELRRALTRRGIVGDPQEVGAPVALRDEAPAVEGAESAVWLAAVCGEGGRGERLVRLERLLSEPAATGKLTALAQILRVSGMTPAQGSAGPEKDPQPGDSFLARVWGAVALVFAVALFALGGGWENIRPTFPSGVVEPQVLPLPVSPDGSQPTPPLVFRWEPSGADVDFAQAILYRRTYERVWESAPTRGNEVEVPLDAYYEIGAGENCYWRVREVADGKPRGSSPYVKFQFEIDGRGYGPGEAPPPDLLVD